MSLLPWVRKHQNTLIPISLLFNWNSSRMKLYDAFQIDNSYKGLMICLWPYE